MKTQTSFWKTPGTAHGGEHAKGRRKAARPVATKRAMHVILRSSRARGAWSLLTARNAAAVRTVTHATAKRFGIKVYRYANVGNHLHLLVQAKRRADFQNFLRVLAQGICFLVTKARKGNPVGKFWDALAFSRAVSWGREFERLLEYLEKNLLEGKGAPRKFVDHWYVRKRVLAKEYLQGSVRLY